MLSLQGDIFLEVPLNMAVNKYFGIYAYGPLEICIVLRKSQNICSPNHNQVDITLKR